MELWPGVGDYPGSHSSRVQVEEDREGWVGAGREGWVRREDSIQNLETGVTVLHIPDIQVDRFVDLVDRPAGWVGKLVDLVDTLRDLVKRLVDFVGKSVDLVGRLVQRAGRLVDWVNRPADLVDRLADLVGRQVGKLV